MVVSGEVQHRCCDDPVGTAASWWASVMQPARCPMPCCRLESRFHFSFADYYNPSNMNFGALRVVNDDLVKPKAGFG